MMHAIPWVAPHSVQALGWSLLHFLWQAALVALLFYAAVPFCRTVRARYTAALLTLSLMALCPVVTFTLLESGAQPSSGTTAARSVIQAVQTLASPVVSASHHAAPTHSSVDWLASCVAVWLLGVSLLGLRALGGWLVIGRLRREKIEPLARALEQRCLALQQRVGVFQRIGYFQSRLVDAPAVVGWFRPIVLLPFAALTGLSPQQLEAVIVHELAHIRRFDSFVNLFQIAVETVLFYHPAVWWVSRFLRMERENCCDDIAVSICEDVTEYARALAVIETWRATPALALAANSAPLKTRIARLIGFDSLTRRSIPRAGLAAIVAFCAAGALLAGVSLHETFAPLLHPDTPVAPSAPVAPPAPAPPASAENAPAPHPPQSPEAPQAPASAPAPPSEPAPASAPEPPPAPAPARGSYIDELHSAGVKDFTVDQLISLKIQGVTPEYVRDLKTAGLQPSVDQLIAMRIHRITPEYIHALDSAGLAHLTIDQYIAARINGITPEFVDKVRRHGFTNLKFDQLLALKFAGIF